MDAQGQERFFTTNGIRLHLIEAGPEHGMPVLLLHGFPEFSYGWRHQIPALAEAGYRVWAPDQRGYHLSDKPQGVAAYRLDELAADILGLIDQSGQPQVHLVGHDWGAAVAWWIAMKWPERLAKLVILNVPHPAVMMEHLRHNVSQMLRSWYIFFFQIPWLPETAARSGDWSLLVRALRRTSRPGTFSEEDLAQYRRAWSQLGAIQSMLNWYRALLQHRPAPPASPKVTVPTLMIWGARDVALGVEMAQSSIDLCQQGQLVTLPEATHWLHHEEPGRVNELILGFLDTET